MRQSHPVPSTATERLATGIALVLGLTGAVLLNRPGAVARTHGVTLWVTCIAVLTTHSIRTDMQDLRRRMHSLQTGQALIRARGRQTAEDIAFLRAQQEQLVRLAAALTRRVGIDPRADGSRPPLNIVR